MSPSSARNVSVLLPVPVSATNSDKLPTMQQETPLPGMEIQTLTSTPTMEQPVPESLRLKDFDVTRFEYKIETEPDQTDVPFRQSLELQAELMQRNSLTVREFKPVKSSPDNDVLSRDAASPQQTLTSPATIGKPDAVQKIQLVFEPPPAPPTVRKVSMDIGDADSQVRVVIHDRNGNLNVQFGAANERLRQELQTSGPLLMRELERDNPMPVRLDFSNFGSATDSDRRRPFQLQERKSLKPGAEFADAAETARLSSSSLTPKSI